MSVSSLTTFQSVGDVSRVVQVETIEELQQFIVMHPESFVLGRGSNTVVSPHIKAPILQVAPSLISEKVSGNELIVSAGTTVSRLMTLCQEHGLSGLEFMAGVPASVGGMVYMNFGCWGKDISQFLTQVAYVDRDGVYHESTPDQLEFSYRHSCFHSTKAVVVSVAFQLEKDDPNVIKERVRSAISKRLSSQPLREKTFGSVFKNPPGMFAAQILEQAGYKGFQFGALKLSEKHANFMVNLGGATFDQFQTFISMIQSDVLLLTGISLELEVQVFS